MALAAIRRRKPQRTAWGDAAAAWSARVAPARAHERARLGEGSAPARARWAHASDSWRAEERARSRCSELATGERAREGRGQLLAVGARGRLSRRSGWGSWSITRSGAGWAGLRELAGSETAHAVKHRPLRRAKPKRASTTLTSKVKGPQSGRHRQAQLQPDKEIHPKLVSKPATTRAVKLCPARAKTRLGGRALHETHLACYASRAGPAPARPRQTRFELRNRVMPARRRRRRAP